MGTRQQPNEEGVYGGMLKRRSTYGYGSAKSTIGTGQQPNEEQSKRHSTVSSIEDPRDIDDLSFLDILNEISIMDSLKERFEEQKIYVSTL